MPDLLAAIAAVEREVASRERTLGGSDPATDGHLLALRRAVEWLHWARQVQAYLKREGSP